jgi:AraC family transcriptional regulator
MQYHETATSKLRLRGLTLAIASYEMRQKVPNHSHENAFLCMALRGVCTEIYGRKVRVFEPSVLSFLPAGNMHSLEFHNTGMHSFSIEIAPLLAQRVGEYSLSLDTSIHCHGGLLTQLYKKTYAEFVRMDDVAPLAIEGLVLEMLAEVSRGQTEGAVDRSPRWLKQAQELIHEQFSESLTLSDISRAVGIHPVHLCRVFREHHRCTIGDYIRRLRIESASRQILTSNAALVEIAAAAGFSDQSHFSRIFKRVMGVTPTEYRAAHRKS